GYLRLFFFQAEDGIRDKLVTGVQTCALPIWRPFPEVGSGVNDSYRLSGRLVPRDVGGKVCESHLLASQFPEEHSQDRSKRRRNRQDTLSRGGRRKEGIERSEERRVGKEWRYRKWRQ